MMSKDGMTCSKDSKLYFLDKIFVLKLLKLTHYWIMIRDNTHMTSMKIARFFKTLTPCPSTSKFFHPVDLEAPKW